MLATRSLGSLIEGLGPGWYQAKAFIAHATSFSFDSLHVVAGVLLQIITALILRTSIQDFRPWLVVFVLEFVNELNDYSVEVWPDRAMQIGEGAKDIFLTILLPTVLLVISRMCPRLLQRAPQVPPRPTEERYSSDR